MSHPVPCPSPLAPYSELIRNVFSPENSLSVSFIQMLKAFHPVAILLISAAFKIQSEWMDVELGWVRREGLTGWAFGDQA